MLSGPVGYHAKPANITWWLNPMNRRSAVLNLFIGKVALGRAVVWFASAHGSEFRGLWRQRTSHRQNGGSSAFTMQWSHCPTIKQEWLKISHPKIGLFSEQEKIYKTKVFVWWFRAWSMTSKLGTAFAKVAVLASIRCPQPRVCTTAVTFPSGGCEPELVILAESCRSQVSKSSFEVWLSDVLQILSPT